MNDLTMRLASTSDASGILEIYAPFIRDTTTTFETEVPSVPLFKERISKYLQKGPWLVAEDDDDIVGYAYATEHRGRAAYQWSIELSVYIHPDYRGQRLATRLYQCAIEIIHLQGYCTILAGITQPNEASDAFHKSIGFSLVGCYNNVGFKHGRWCDVKWYELSLNKFDLPPKPIIDLKTLKDAGRLEAILEYHNSEEGIQNI